MKVVLIIKDTNSTTINANKYKLSPVISVSIIVCHLLLSFDTTIVPHLKLFNFT